MANESQRAFTSEKLARAFARDHKPTREVSVIHSPHENNTSGDYFVDWSVTCGFTRSWETLLYQGKGAKA